MNIKLSGSEFKKRAAKRLHDEIEILKKVPKIGSLYVELAYMKTIPQIYK